MEAHRKSFFYHNDNFISYLFYLFILSGRVIGRSTNGDICTQADAAFFHDTLFRHGYRQLSFVWRKYIFAKFTAPGKFSSHLKWKNKDNYTRSTNLAAFHNCSRLIQKRIVRVFCVYFSFLAHRLRRRKAFLQGSNSSLIQFDLSILLFRSQVSSCSGRTGVTGQRRPTDPLCSSVQVPLHWYQLYMLGLLSFMDCLGGWNVTKRMLWLVWGRTNEPWSWTWNGPKIDGEWSKLCTARLPK